MGKVGSCRLINWQQKVWFYFRFFLSTKSFLCFLAETQKSFRCHFHQYVDSFRFNVFSYQFCDFMGWYVHCLFTHKTNEWEWQKIKCQLLFCLLCWVLFRAYFFHPFFELIFAIFFYRKNASQIFSFCCCCCCCLRQENNILMTPLVRQIENCRHSLCSRQSVAFGRVHCVCVFVVWFSAFPFFVIIRSNIVLMSCRWHFAKITSLFVCGACYTLFLFHQYIIFVYFILPIRSFTFHYFSSLCFLHIFFTFFASSSFIRFIQTPIHYAF